MLDKLLVKYRRQMIALAHLVFIVVAYVGAFFIRFEFTLPARYLLIILATIPLLILIKVIVFYWCGLYWGYGDM